MSTLGTTTSPASESTQIQLTCVAEVEELAAPASNTFLLMVHIKAPIYSSDERRTRAPVVISSVLDRSGSMAGSKLELVKKTMQFVLTNMKSEDQIGIVTYDSSVKEELKLTLMTAEGRQKAADTVNGITDGGQTNLSGGLFEGLKQIQEAAQDSSQSSNAMSQDTSPAHTAVVSSVWLFTDGLANSGITEAAEIKAETEKRLASISSACSVFAFGFGSDHNSSMLQDISKVGNGLYYYIETEDRIPEAFADCLGGLLSVAAQNLMLIANPVGTSCKIVKVSTVFKSEVKEGSATVRVPDIYSEEARDIIFQVEVPALEAPQVEAKPILHFTVQYFNVLTCAQEEVSCSCQLSRPEACVNPPKPIPLELDKQKNRIMCTEALAEARQLGQAGRLVAAREVLQKAMEIIRRSPSALEAYCLSLLSDLQECLDKLVDQPTYLCYGAHAMTSYEESHGCQRSSHRTPAYQTETKMMMCFNANQI